MAHFVATAHSPKSVEEVFTYLADFRTVCEWDPSIKQSLLSDGELFSKNACFTVVVNFLGRDTTLRYHTVDIDRPNRIVLRAENGAVVSEDTIELHKLPNNEGTKVVYDAQLSAKGAMKLAEPLLRLIFSRICRRAENGLREKLAS